MKQILFLILIVICSGFTPNITSDCADDNLYANKKRTSLVNRFNNYEKIKGVPKFKG